MGVGWSLVSDYLRKADAYVTHNLHVACTTSNKTQVGLVVATVLPQLPLCRSQLIMARSQALGRFVCRACIEIDVFDVLENSAQGKDLYAPDVIIVDPPRVGMTPDAVRKIASYNVPQIVYISCNPKSLVQNLSQFTTYGYRTDYVKPFDNFPMTKHVETVVLLRGKKLTDISR